MDIGGGDESDTQIVSYKKWKTTQPTIQSIVKKGSQHLYHAPKRLTRLIVVNPLGFHNYPKWMKVLFKNQTLMWPSQRAKDLIQRQVNTNDHICTW
jgi:hypothetical protein